jgi:hypothetical protein
MRRLPLARITVAVAALCLLNASAPPERAHAEIAFEPSWQAPTYDSVRKRALAWLDEANLDDQAADKVRELWPKQKPADAAPGTLLDRVAQSLALASPEAKALVTQCGRPYEGPSTPKPEWLADSKNPEFLRNNLRLYYARWLAQYGLYDEVLEQVGELRPADVVDPAALLFYQMVAYHQLVRPDEARAALAGLMEHEDQLPRRYHEVAQLVQRDLGGLEDESLDHIARRMRDVRRRLAYGRAGTKVQAVEKGVLDSLDKKIKDLEDKQRQQQQQAAAQASGKSSGKTSKPMEDSRIAELKGPMKVDRRDIGHESGWGDLPPKEREQALQQIGRDFPAHYRELIEDYFRELANESNEAASPAKSAAPAPKSPPASSPSEK